LLIDKNKNKHEKKNPEGERIEISAKKILIEIASIDRQFDESELLDKSDKFTADFLIETIFPLFLESDNYKSYIERKSFNGSTEISIRSIIPSEHIINDESTRDHRLDPLFKKTNDLNC
jgi:hypothetical protein